MKRAWHFAILVSIGIYFSFLKIRKMIVCLSLPTNDDKHEKTIAASTTKFSYFRFLI
jgi:hypothetical protein